LKQRCALKKGEEQFNSDNGDQANRYRNNTNIKEVRSAIEAATSLVINKMIMAIVIRGPRMFVNDANAKNAADSTKSFKSISKPLLSKTDVDSRTLSKRHDPAIHRVILA
jgi:hypothetical protein